MCKPMQGPLKGLKSMVIHLNPFNIIYIGTAMKYNFFSAKLAYRIVESPLTDKDLQNIRTMFKKGNLSQARKLYR